MTSLFLTEGSTVQALAVAEKAASSARSMYLYLFMHRLSPFSVDNSSQHGVLLF